MNQTLLQGPQFYWLGFIIGVLVSVFYFKLLYTPKRRKYYQISWYDHIKKETIYKYISLKKEMSLNLYKYLIDKGIVNERPNLRSNPMIKELNVEDMENEYSLKRDTTLYIL